MNREQICLFTTHLRDGGAQRVLLNLSDTLVNRGFEVDLVLTRSGPQNYDIPDGVQVVNIAAPRIYASLPGVVRYLSLKRPATLLSAGTAINIIVLLAKKLVRLDSPVVVSEHGVLSVSIEASTDWRTKFVPPLVRKLYPSADSIVAVSEGVSDDLQREFSIDRNQIRIIHNPIVTPEMIEKSKQPLNHSWFNSTDIPIILGAGRLNPVKDFSTLIRGFAKLRRVRQARLIILGEGQKRSELEELAEELDVEQSVLLPGFVNNPYKYMRNADVFVLSSKREGFGNVLVEAMACGCPVVSTDCPHGPSEILEGGKWGHLVPVESPEKLSSAIQDMLDNPIDPRRRAQKFHIDRIAESYVSLFKNLDAK